MTFVWSFRMTSCVIGKVGRSSSGSEPSNSGSWNSSSAVPEPDGSTGIGPCTSSSGSSSMSTSLFCEDSFPFEGTGAGGVSTFFTRQFRQNGANKTDEGIAHLNLLSLVPVKPRRVQLPPLRGFSKPRDTHCGEYIRVCHVIVGKIDSDVRT